MATTADRDWRSLNLQPEVGAEAYNRGAAMWTEFVRQEARSFLEPDLLPKGREVIERCLQGGTVGDHDALMR